MSEKNISSKQKTILMAKLLTLKAFADMFEQP